MSPELTPDDLPLDPDEFTERILAEVDDYIEAHGLGESQFESPASMEEMKTGLQTRLFNEIQNAMMNGEMLADADDPTVFIQLCKQMEDEAKHARLLAQRLKELGEDPSESYDRAAVSSKSQWGYYRTWLSSDVVKGAAALQCGSERAVAERHLNESEYYDAETRAIYEDVITPDEKFHTQVGVNAFRRLCTDRASQLRALRTSREMRRAFWGSAVEGVYQAPTADAD